MIRRFAPCLFLCAVLAGCGGGGSGGSTLPQSPAVKPDTNPAAATQRVKFSITIPGRTSASIGRRQPLYISQNTQSASITVNSGTPVIVDLASGSPNCVGSGSNRVCTATISAPVGPDTFVETMYASTNGTGAALSVSTTPFTIASGQANVVNMTLDGVVAAIALSLTPAAPPIGPPATIAVGVNFTDASGAIIVGNDPFANPITLSDSDTTGATKLSKTQLLSPQDATNLTVSYTGASIGPATFGASAAGVPAGNIKSAVLTPQNSGAFVDWPTYAFDSARTGFNPATSAITPAAVSKYHLGWQAGIGNAQSQPVIATNIAGHKALVIIAGYKLVQAYDALSGAVVWKASIPGQPLQSCGTAGTGGTVLYDPAQSAVYVAGGNGSNPNHVALYRLAVDTGAMTGSVDVTPTLVANEVTSTHTSVTLANGLLYFGTGSNCEGGAYPDLASWRGRVVAVNPGSMTLVNTFYTTWGQGGNYGGGGVWAWGGVSADSSGNIYVGAGNAETPTSIDPSQSIQPPFVPAGAENVGFAEHLVQLSSDLSTVKGSDAPIFNFQIGCCDLDYTGTPVVYQPPIGSGCDELTATQGKGGTLVINDTQHVAGALNTYKLSVPSPDAWYIGNPAYSPNSGLLYAAISSSGPGSSLLPPGLAAIQGCGANGGIAWNTQFGPDTAAYSGDNPRSAPTVTAGDAATGGVVFMGTPCTPDGNGSCGPASGDAKGALWAVSAKSGSLLGGGKPILITGANIRMAPTVDGLWMYVLDSGGNLYALTIDPNVPAIAAKAVQRTPQTFNVHKYDH